MNLPDDRDTLPPGPGDDITDRERLKLIENGMTDMRGAMNLGFAAIHKLLGEMRADMAAMSANTGVIRNTVRRHSERLRAIEIDMEKPHMNGNGGHK